jgi:hypothetical protein
MNIRKIITAATLIGALITGVAASPASAATRSEPVFQPNAAVCTYEQVGYNAPGLMAHVCLARQYNSYSKLWYLTGSIEIYNYSNSAVTIDATVVTTENVYASTGKATIPVSKSTGILYTPMHQDKSPGTADYAEGIIWYGFNGQLTWYDTMFTPWG